MKRILQLLFVLLCNTMIANAAGVKGFVYDLHTGEPLAGATILLQKTGKTISSGLDGSFEFKNVGPGKIALQVSYTAYETITKEINLTNDNAADVVIYLQSNKKLLEGVSVTGTLSHGSEVAARRIEQNAVQVMNIVSGRAIEVSPDLTVANVIQRVSGVSVERNSNGDGQYAILRGMDKRYNYTLVNGIKIPSPDNKYRYVPLDLFPSDLLERLEVYKTLTPNVEGDAIGGGVNMVMKNAPQHFQINANIATGYNQLFFERDFASYKASAVNKKSPYEINGREYNAVPGDFPKATLDYDYKKPAPNLVGSLSLGQRFANNKLGVIVAGSYQNTYRGSNSTFYNSAVSGTDAYAVITSKVYREYSEQQKRWGIHGKVDYVLNQNHKIDWYNVYVNLDNIQVRDAVNTPYNGSYNPDAGNSELVYSLRSRLTQQQIYNSTLHGDHKFFAGKLKTQWSAVFSSARNAVPDNTSISLNGLQQNFEQKRTSLVNTSPVNHRWERNTDDDKAAYLDFTYTALIGHTNVDFSVGGLYRDKQRSSFYNNYTLAPAAGHAGDLYGVDFQNYTELNLVVTNPTGAVSNSLTYDASEKIKAGYGMVSFTVNKLDVLGGARVEHTNQGYNLLFPAGENNPAGSQVYTDVLPSVTLKYHFTRKAQLHASYYKALNRPGFYEIVPGKVVNEEYQERGNPNLERALADNFDLRYELFPKASEQLLVGVFYKKINNPIEYTFQPDATRGQDIYYSPGNFGTAKNYGAEADYIKFFNKIGVKANYTYTHSRITTPKTSRKINSTTGDIEAYLVNQTRPLYGQSEHIANISLLYKNTNKGWEAQLAAAYTGPRINTVSQFLNNDLWQEGFVQMDVSAEKRFKTGISLFVKGGNLLNTPTRLFIKGTNPENLKIKENIISGNRTLVRNDYYGQSYLIGIRYKLN